MPDSLQNNYLLANWTGNCFILPEHFKCIASLKIYTQAYNFQINVESGV